MSQEIRTFNDQHTAIDKDICNLLLKIIDNELTEAESKIWHAHPVWFLDGNPITKVLKRWLKKSRIIQSDYKNIVKRKGKLVRL
jgi:hypothetical protein